MKKVLCISLMAVTSITVYCQQIKPLKVGIELDGKLKTVDSGTFYDSPTGAAYVGMFAELRLTGHFSGKLSAGLNNTYIHQDEMRGYDYTGQPFVNPELTKVTQTLSIGLEPRYYFFTTEQPRKGNLYAALPVIFEMKSLGEV